VADADKAALVVDKMREVLCTQASTPTYWAGEESHKLTGTNMFAIANQLATTLNSDADEYMMDDMFTAALKAKVAAEFALEETRIVGILASWEEKVPYNTVECNAAGRALLVSSERVLQSVKDKATASGLAEFAAQTLAKSHASIKGNIELFTEKNLSQVAATLKELSAVVGSRVSTWFRKQAELETCKLFPPTGAATDAAIVEVIDRLRGLAAADTDSIIRTALEGKPVYAQLLPDLDAEVTAADNFSTPPRKARPAGGSPMHDTVSKMKEYIAPPMKDVQSVLGDVRDAAVQVWKVCVDQFASDLLIEQAKRKTKFAEQQREEGLKVAAEERVKLEKRRAQEREEDHAKLVEEQARASEATAKLREEAAARQQAEAAAAKAKERAEQEMQRRVEHERRLEAQEAEFARQQQAAAAALQEERERAEYERRLAERVKHAEVVYRPSPACGGGYSMGGHTRGRSDSDSDSDNSDSHTSGGAGITWDRNGRAHDSGTGRFISKAEVSRRTG
jgi:dihydroxyacetone kinase DhaKLM complex PTS-EIIA-like component DhaM